MGIAIGGFHFEYAIAQFQYGDIKGTSTQVKDSDLQIGTLLIKSVSQGGRCRLIDDPLDLKSGDLTGFFGGLTPGSPRRFSSSSEAPWLRSPAENICGHQSARGGYCFPL